MNPSSQDTMDTAAPDDPVRQMLTAYAAAVFAKDSAALASLYADDVSVFDLWHEASGEWVIAGLPAWREACREWLDSLGDERVQVAVSQVCATAAGELAVGHALMRYTALAPDGRTLRAMDNRITVTLRRRAGAWQVTHQHTSAPVDMATGQVVLHRST